MGFENVRIPWKGWKVIKEIGKGGFGTVYEIKRMQSGIEDLAALKVIRIPNNKGVYNEKVIEAGSEEEAREYFEHQKKKIIEEVENLKEFQGTGNIVCIEDWYIEELEDRFGWELMIRMELLTPLEDKLIEEGTLTEEEIVKLGKDICTALKMCEKKEIIHRDIKPANILVSKLGDYKLADFGVSRHLENTMTVTQGVGSRPYMAPEIDRGGQADKSIDTYSLGLVMYKLLNSNRLPFFEPTGLSRLENGRAVQRRMDGERIPEPPNGSDALKRIVLKACEYKPEDRYKNAGQMLRDLNKLDIEPAFVRPKETTLYCTYCGQRLPVGGIYCSACGARVPDLVSGRGRTMDFIDAPSIEIQRETIAQFDEYVKSFEAGAGIIRDEPVFEIPKIEEKPAFEEPKYEDPAFEEAVHWNDELGYIIEDRYLDLEIERPEDEKPSDVLSLEELAMPSDSLSLEDLEKDIFGEIQTPEAEAEETKKIDKFYTLYRKNEEFQRLLDEEYDKLKGDAAKAAYAGNAQVDDEAIYKAFEIPPELMKDKAPSEVKDEETDKIDKFYDLYRKNGEFQRLLDELKDEGAAAEKPASAVVEEVIPSPAPAAEVKSLKNRLKGLIGVDTNRENDGKEKSSEGLSLEELERDIFGETPTTEAEAEETENIDKFYSLYKKNEEFQKLLDNEYDKLKREAEKQAGDDSDENKTTYC